MDGRLPADAGVGAAGGTAATFVMTTFMLAAEAAGWMTEQPPTRLARRGLVAARQAGSPVADPGSRAELTLTAAGLHLAVGAGAGAIYGAMRGRAPLRRLPPVVRGLMFGTALWTAAYAGLLPAVGLMPPPGRDERRRPQAMLLAHWVFGATLAIVAHRD